MRRGRALAALAAAGAGLALAPAAMAAPSAKVDIIHPPFQGGISNASTFTAAAKPIKVANTSSAGEKITSIAIDLADGPTVFPDLVFDPDGVAGDTVGRSMILESFTGAATLVPDAPAFTKPLEGGFGAVSMAFPQDDFVPGVIADFTADIDPTSIKGSVGSKPAGPIAGSEIQGATVTVTFSDGTTLTNDLSLVPGSQTDVQAVLAPGVLAAPIVTRAGGASAPVATAKAAQQLIVTGPAGASGVLVVSEGHLDVEDAPNGGTDLDPFEANMGVKFTEYPFTIGPDGTALVSVTLTDSAPLEDSSAPGTFFAPSVTGINSITAHLTSGGTAGEVSAPLVIQLDPSVEVAPPAITDVSPIDAQKDVARNQSLQITFSEPMDAGTVLADGAITLTKGSGGSATPVAATVTKDETGTIFTVDPAADLDFDTDYTVTVGTNPTDVAGNALAAPLTWSFRTVKEQLPPPPPPPAAPTNTGDPVCVVVPKRPTNTGKGQIKLEAAQLLISQRIAQAAVRRANAIEQWLESGIVAGDLCGNAFGQSEFTGLTYVGGGVTAPVGPIPRALQVEPASAGSGGTVALSAQQLLINQRISQAAVRRVNALAARLAGSLTGGDLVDGSIGRGKLLNGLVIASATAGTPVAKSQTILGERGNGGGTVTVSVRQLQINQRISQAAVRRVNELVDQLARGLTAANFKDGSLTAVDLAAEARPS
jgi:hypothetical protein